MNILVTGAGGQLSSELAEIASDYKEFKFHFLSQEDLDITNPEAIEECFTKLQPEFCINCAAYTAVDLAETEQDKAFAVNETAVEYLVAACSTYDSTFIHVSTDFVFDGNSKKPIAVDLATFPLNVYGKSKLGGELAAKMYPKSVIIRTSWVFSSFGNNFVKTMLRLGGEREELNVVADQVGRPTYAADLAVTIMEMVEQLLTEPQYGVYHYANEGSTTWYHFASAIMKAGNLNCTIHPISSGSYPTAATRPRYSVLDTTKIEDYLELQVPTWEDALDRCLKKL